MAFEINGANPIAMQAYSNLAVNQSQASQALAKVSRGDNAGNTLALDSVAAVSQLQSTLASSQRAITSTQNAINTLEVASAAYAQALTLAEEGLALAEARGVAGADVGGIDAQLAAIAGRMSDIASVSNAAGSPILGQSLTVMVNGSGTSRTVTPDPISSVDTSGSLVAGYTNAVSAISASAATNSANLTGLYGNLQTLEATVVTQQSAVGQIVDIGLTAEMMELTSAGIMADSVTAVLAQSTQMSESVLKLL